MAISDKRLREIAAIPDEAIDTSDIPEPTPEQLAKIGYLMMNEILLGESHTCVFELRGRSVHLIVECISDEEALLTYRALEEVARRPDPQILKIHLSGLRK